jgi:sulfite reductase (NADPH) hemoprotein beta-component
LKADIEQEFEKIRFGVLRLPEEEVRRIEAYFAPPPLEVGAPRLPPSKRAVRAMIPGFAQFRRTISIRTGCRAIRP